MSIRATYSRIQDRKQRPWSVPLVPGVASGTLTALGEVEESPSAPVLWIVRLPYLRVVSAWRCLRADEAFDTLWGGDWPAWLRSLKDSDLTQAEPRLIPQYLYVEGILLPKMVRLNMLSEHIAPPGFERVNEGDPAIPWPKYEKENEELINQLYAEDMAAFRAAIG